jgi:glycosyltransferase involved in cell wall biosynthesis
MLAVVPGADGVHPGSTYVRIVQRYRHPTMSWKLSLALRYADQSPLRLPADVALVQRTALDPADTEPFLATLRERELPLLLDLDDHLLIKGAADAHYGQHQGSLAALVRAASLVLVSTERLKGPLSGQARAVELVPNLIDERLFLSGVRERPRGARREFDRPLQLVYVGSPTHAADLAMLRPVMDMLSETHPRAFELNVVGAERPGPGQEWYRRCVVPDRCKPYPQFVQWLREQRSQWDIAVAPLQDDAFNSYKSDLKHLEYGALGLPSIFSDREPYATVEHGRTGLKVSDQVDDWSEALVALREDGGLRDAIADAAFEYVVSERLMRHGADSLLQLICAI